MGRLPKIVMMIAAMTAIFLWLSTAFNSCGNKAGDDLLDDSEFVLDDSGEPDFMDDSDDIFESNSDDSSDDYDTDNDFVQEEEETDYVESEPDYTTPTSSSSSSKSSSSTYSAPRTYSSAGQYMVIAGNYLVESNANVMIRKLSNLGYSNAERAVFDRSQYHTVVAYRSDNYASALEVSNAVKRQGVECYVKKRQY